MTDLDSGATIVLVDFAERLPMFQLYDSELYAAPSFDNAGRN